MQLPFAEGFEWGTATAVGQIETASDHNLRDLKAMDGHLLRRTTDHERQRLADVDHIARLGSNYRCGLDWARLQAAPYTTLSKAVVAEYREFFAALNGRGVKVTLVMHHVTHPSWFEADGGWAWESNLPVFYDYAARVADAFGDHVHAWSTFDEPNLYALNAHYRGLWPPYAASLPQASRVLGNMARAHVHVYGRLKAQFPHAMVGYALHTAYVDGKGFAGQAASKLFDWWFYARPVKLFAPTDYVGVAHRAYVPFAPKPISALHQADTLDSLGIRHDRLWGFQAEGFGEMLRRVYRDTNRPLWVVSTAVCSASDEQRTNYLSEYLMALHGVIRERVPVIGYSPGSPWDAFNWHLGPTYREGLMRLDIATLERGDTQTAEWYAQLVRDNTLSL